MRGADLPPDEEEASIMRLAIYQNGRFLRAVSLAKDSVRIGRLPSCDLVLEGDGVARYHAVVERALDGNWNVMNMGAGGTCVNGQPITLAKVKLGDEVSIGHYRLMFMDESSAPKRMPPPPPPPDFDLRFEEVEGKTEPPDLVIVSSGGELVAAPVAPVLWSATADEMNAEPKTGEVVIPIELMEPEEPIFLLTHKKRRST
jgi:hypothetical protein